MSMTRWCWDKVRGTSSKGDMRNIYFWLCGCNLECIAWGDDGGKASPYIWVFKWAFEALWYRRLWAKHWKTRLYSQVLNDLHAYSGPWGLFPCCTMPRLVHVDFSTNSFSSQEGPPCWLNVILKLPKLLIRHKRRLRSSGRLEFCLIPVIQSCLSEFLFFISYSNHGLW